MVIREVTTTNHIDMELADLIKTVNAMALACMRGDMEGYREIKEGCGYSDSELYNGAMSMLIGQVRLACQEADIDPERYLQAAALELAQMSAAEDDLTGE